MMERDKGSLGIRIKKWKKRSTFVGVESHMSFLCASTWLFSYNIALSE